jgi:hypothetical protein
MSSIEAESIRQTYQQATGMRSRDARRDSHAEFVWKLARKFTNSNEEAMAAAEEMFADIRRCAEEAEEMPPIEERLTARIAFRRLLKLLQ